jgi:hypothetical protein
MPRRYEPKNLEGIDRDEQRAFMERTLMLTSKSVATKEAHEILSRSAKRESLTPPLLEVAEKYLGIYPVQVRDCIGRWSPTLSAATHG